jgi:tetratricopeptide (TPR) repeat protein
LQVEFAKEMVATDIHYSERYDNGYRLRSWGVFLKEVGDFAGAAEAFSKRLVSQPEDIKALTMLVPSLYQLERFREAHQRCLQGLRVDPGNINFLYKAIYTALRIGELDRALQLLANSPAEFRDSPPVARLYAGIIGAQGYHQRAVELARIYAVRDTDGYLPYLLARSSIAVGDHQLADSLINRALALDPDNQDYRHFRDSLRSLDNR